MESTNSVHNIWLLEAAILPPFECFLICRYNVFGLEPSLDTVFLWKPGRMHVSLTVSKVLLDQREAWAVIMALKQKMSACVWEGERERDISPADGAVCISS